ncbi:hypothetical protein NL108_008061, partial [Boleophthalmus pectinirostris]
LVLLLLLMFAVGCTMELSKIKDHLIKPKGVFIAMVTQFGIMPLTAFCLSKAFQLTDIDAVVVLLCGCCPGGNASNLLTVLLKGDMNLSIVMTTCSTVISLGMMPLLIFLYCQGFDSLHHFVPYKSIMISLIYVLICSGSGILLNYLRPRAALICSKVGIVVCNLGLLVYLIWLCLKLGDVFWLVLSLTMQVIAVFMPLIGFILGYVFSWIFRLSPKECRAVSMETGCQNAQLCFGILKMAFAPEVLGAVMSFPVLYGLYQFLEGLFIVMIFRTYQYCADKLKKHSFVPAKTE